MVRVTKMEGVREVGVVVGMCTGGTNPFFNSLSTFSAILSKLSIR